MCGTIGEAMVAQPVWEFGWGGMEPTEKQAPPAGETRKGNSKTAQPVGESPLCFRIDCC